MLVIFYFWDLFESLVVLENAKERKIIPNAKLSERC